MVAVLVIQFLFSLIGLIIKSLKTTYISEFVLWKEIKIQVTCTDIKY